MNFEKILKTVCFVLAAYVAVAFLYSSALKITYPYSLGLGEAALSQNIARAGQGILPYKDLNVPPYTLVPYGPVFVLLSALANLILSGPFMGARLVCALASIGTAVAIFLTLKRSGAPISVAVLSAATFLSHVYITIWGVQVNVDMTGVFLAVTAFFCFQSFLVKDCTDKRWFIAGIIFVTAAFFTKSSMIACGASFFIYLLVTKRFSWALRYFLIQGVSLAVVYGLLCLVTHGWYYTHTTYEISKRLFFHEFITRFWWDTLKVGPALVVGTILAFLVWVVRRQFSFIFFYLLFAVLLTVSLGKQGSDTNYFLEWLAVASLALGFLWQEFQGRFKIAVIALIFVQLLYGIDAYADLGSLKGEYQERKEFFDKLSILVKRVDGKILSEDMALLLANGKEIYYEPFPMGQMTYSGVWDNRPILQALENKEFKLAILLFYAPKLQANRTFPRNFMTAFNANYVYKGYVTLPWHKGPTPLSYFFYEPKK